MGNFNLGSGLDVPGLEAIFEYNGLKRIGDRTSLDSLDITSIGGLADDPDLRDSRDTNPDRHGERPGIQLYSGRQLTFEGKIKAGGMAALRDTWRSVKRIFDNFEHDLTIHPPGEVQPVVNLIKNPRIQIDTSSYASNFSAGLVSTSFARAAMPDNAAEFGIRVQATQPADTTQRSAGVVAATPGTNYVPIVGGRQYTLYSEVYVADASVDAPTGLRLDALWLRGDGTTSASLASVAGTMIPDVTGQRFRLRETFTSPRDALLLRIQARQYTATSGDVLDAYWTRFMVVEGSYQGPYIDGDQLGCWWTGTPQASTSIGGTLDVNLIKTPTFESFAEGTAVPTGTGWITITASDSSETSQAIVSSGWSKQGTKSAFVRIRRDDGATAVLRHGSGTTGTIRVAPGETLFFKASLNVITAIALDKTQISVNFYKSDGSASTVAASLQPAASANGQTGIFDLIGSVVVPSDSVLAAPAILNTMGAGTTNNIWEFYVDQIYFGRTDPGLVFTGDDDHGVWTGARENSESIRRKPRPFVLRGVRKTDRLSSPEKQDALQARRDFLITARSSDPRIYVNDMRTRWLQLSGTPNYVDNQPPFVAAGTPPTGYTSILTGANVDWAGNSSFALISGRPVLLGAPNSVISTIQYERVYRSAEGFTYTDPFVRMQGSWAVSTSPMFSSVSTVGGEQNHFEAIIKRIDNSNYIGARWYLTEVGGGGGSFIPVAKLGFFKVTAAGAPVALGTDITVPISATSGLNSYLLAYASGNNLFVGIYTTYPTPLDSLPSAVASTTFTLTSTDATTFGAGVAGSTGFGFGKTDIATATPLTGLGAAFQYPNLNPWIGRFETGSYAAAITPSQMLLPVIGDFEDTPPILTLAGDVNSPSVTLALPSGDVRQVALSGTYADSDPATLDFNGNQFATASGTDLWDTWRPFSDFLSFEPGVVAVSVLALAWTAGKYQIGLSWRDAYR